MTDGLYFSHPACLEHDPRPLSPGHPDTPERLLAIERALEDWDWSGWERREAPAASEAQLELVHSPRHVGAIRELCTAGGGAVDADTFVGESSFRAALHAAGAGVAMTSALLAGEAGVGFATVRPPGHHAEPERAMGFCLFNNVAVAAELAIRELGARRVFVLDWDVHHGNGTAEAFRERDDVLYASIHQSPFYPGTGALSDAGTGRGEGYTINLPVPAGSGEELWLALLEQIVLPAAGAFEPDLVLVSAGFDGHRDDPLANCNLQTGSFARMAERVRALAGAAHAPLGVILEGGYEPHVLGECVRAALVALGHAGEARAAAGGEGRTRPDGRPAPSVPDRGASALQSLTSRAVAQVGRYWAL